MASPGLTAIQLAQEEAAKLNITLADSAAEYVLWECTRYPMFDDVEELRTQVREALIDDLGNWRLGGPTKTSGPTSWDKIVSED